MNYAAHDHLIAAARRRPAIWRLILGLALVFAVIVALISVVMAFYEVTGRGASRISANGDTPKSTFLMLASFSLMYPGLWIALHFLHKRRLRSLFGAAGPFWHAVWRTVPITIALYIAGLILTGFDFDAPKPALPLAIWLKWLAPALVALAIQVTAEELIVRGYIQSQLAARFRSPLVWLVLPALLFAVLHYNPSEAGANAPWLLLPPLAFGLLAADLTARCGNLGPAIAIHFINNFAAIFLIAPMGMLSGLALYRLPVELSDPAMLDTLPVELAFLFILWLCVRLALRK